MAENGTAESKEIKADVVVVGGGGAGLAAAVTAAEKGARVVVLEKRGGPGGNSAFAWGICAAESNVQKRAMIDCSRDYFFKTAMDFAHWRINSRIVRALVDKSAETIDWLETKGLEFSCFPLYPNQVPTWHIPKGRGAALVKNLVENGKNLGVQLLTGTPAKSILTSPEGGVTGVLAANRDGELPISCQAVILATGGYAGNKELLKKYSPYYRDNMGLVGLPHTGDGLIMAMETGAATEGLGILHTGGPATPDNISLKVGTPPDTFRIRLMGIALEPYTVWVNNKGERFIDEAVGRHHYMSSNAVLRQPGSVSYTLFDGAIMETMIDQGLILGMGLPEGAQGNKLPGLARELGTVADKGLIKMSNSWEEIGDWIGTDGQILKNTVDEYNAACDRGYDQLFTKDRRYLVPLRTPPYYAISCHVSLMGTIGGIKINEKMEVLDKQDKCIRGLYAAGADTGGWESDTYCDVLSGHAFGFAVNSGRIAGENAAALARVQP
ncbi:MAG TPA: FAD-dependent oxidoreductase [Spirochaetia bacterium]|nr:FAD-dependent oxidoreductase [Spirochaetia bacterium]